MAAQRVVEPLDELNGGILSTATAPDECYHLSWFHCQTHSLQDLNVWTGGVCEVDVPQFNGSR